MKKNTILGLTAAAALAFGTLAAQAAPQQQGPPSGEHRHWGMRGQGTGQGQGPGHRFGMFMANSLNLTDDQKTQAKAIFKSGFDQSKPLLDQMKANRQAINQAVETDQTANLQSLTAAQGQLAGQLALIRANAFGQFYKLLTPDQQAKLKDLENKRHGAKSQTEGPGL